MEEGIAECRMRCTIAISDNRLDVFQFLQQRLRSIEIERGKHRVGGRCYRSGRMTHYSEAGQRAGNGIPTEGFSRLGTCQISVAVLASQ